ncbi:hypothetical protein V6N11_044799 [Hibiscus sabdariffa]|uniref:Uncharacterized protein n=1 Tax=Hibiscus sabdariffa TaxID=183260 RepID=A0ABR2PTY4_9ROSI
MVDDLLSFCCDLGGLVNNLKFLSRLVRELGSNVKVLAFRKLTSTLQTNMDFFRERSCSLLLEVEISNDLVQRGICLLFGHGGWEFRGVLSTWD